jgi:hypothetical protein
MEQMLEILAAVRLCREKSFPALEHLVLTHAGDLSGCVCVLLSWDGQRQRLVKALLGRNIPLRVLVVAACQEPLAPGVMEGQPANFHVLPVNQVAEKLAWL